MRKGGITVFLSLVFVLLLAFVSGIIQSSVVRTAGNLSRLETDRAVYSIFGEYQKQLLEQYQIFVVEGSYGTGTYEEENLVRRMHCYETGNTDHEVTEIQYLTDNNGQAFREQVLTYMEQKYGLSLIQEFTGLTSQWEEQEIQSEETREQQEDVMREMQQLGGLLEDSQEEGQQEENTENPFEFMEKIQNTGLISVVLPEEMTLSEKEIDPDMQVSYRGLTSGRGTFAARSNMNGIEEKLLFDEYVLKKFDNAALGDGDEIPDNRTLDYEVEYILSGKSSDKDNLESVLLKIFLIRIVLNYVYLMTDTGKQGEAQILALAISALLMIPEAVEVIKQLILAAWAAGESVVDIRSLLAGKRAALIKNAENWQTSLTSLFTLGSERDGESGSDAAGGLSYEDYLRAFLFIGNSDKVTMRTLDRVEENLKSEQELEFIRMDHCVAKIEMKNTALIYGNLTYQFPVRFGYE